MASSCDCGGAIDWVSFICFETYGKRGRCVSCNSLHAVMRFRNKEEQKEVVSALSEKTDEDDDFYKQKE